MSKQPIERTLEAQLLGRPVTFSYSETWVAWSVLSLRLIMGYVFLSAGLEKLLDPDGWSSAAFLNPETPFGVTGDNPLSGIFAEMSASASMVDPIVIFGQIMIGLALILGVAVRFAAFWGAVQMILFWLAALEGGLLEGLPVEHGYVVDSSLVYAFILFGLGAVGAGRVLGLDRHIEEMEFVKNNPWIKYLLG